MVEWWITLLIALMSFLLGFLGNGSFISALINKIQGTQ